MRRVVLAGTGSGVGKTSIAAGLMLRMKCEVQPFKVGPDFIDPMFHAMAAGRPSRNLDSFMMEPDIMKEHFRWACRGADLALIEGVRGLYDGLTSTEDTGSTAEIAKMLDAPVVLVINARSLAKSAAVAASWMVVIFRNAGIVFMKESVRRMVRKMSKQCGYRFSPIDENEDGLIRSSIYCREKICIYWDSSISACGYHGPVGGICV